LRRQPLRILAWFATSPTIIAEACATIFASSIGGGAQRSARTRLDPKPSRPINRPASVSKAKPARRLELEHACFDHKDRGDNRRAPRVS
jgi:hypothetical protein